MAHLQYIPGDPRLVDQLVYELKSKGIFDQFRKDCIADVDTRPAYQNLRQRVENSVTTFLSRQVWKPDLNKNQLREKLRKHILDGNYLEQGVERIVDQVVNPKVASVFIPQVEDLVYNYLGITRKKSAPVAETSNGKVTSNDLLPTDLEAVSPGSVKSNDDKTEDMDVPEMEEDVKMETNQDEKEKEIKDEDDKIKSDPQDTQLSGISELTSHESNSMDKSSIPLPSEEIKLENIPEPDNSPPKAAKVKVELENIKLPMEPNVSTDIPLPEEIPKTENEHYFKPVNSEDDDSSSDSSIIRNMSPLTPIRNFNNENSCDAQQAFDDDLVDSKSDDKKDTAEPSTFRFTIETKAENSSDAVKTEKKETESLSYQFNTQVNLNTFNTPMYDDSSNSNNLQIDYESDVSKNNSENKIPEPDHNSEDSRKEKKSDEKKSSHRSSHHRDSHRHSSSKDRRSDSKQSSSKDSRSDKKSSKDDHKSSSKSSSSHKDKSSEKSDKKDSRDSSKHRSSSSHKSSSSHRDSKSHRSSSSSHRHSSSSKHSDERKSSSSNKDRSDKSSDKYSKEKSSKDSKSSSSSHRSDKDRKSSSSKSKSEDKDKQKKDKKDTDDHYSASGRGNHTRRSTDRDSNDGSSSSKGSHNHTSSKSSEVKKESKGSTSKSDNTSTSGDSTSPSDKDVLVNEMKNKSQNVPQVKPVVRIENHLEVPISSPPRLPFVPDVTLKKPKFAANMQEARKLMKMRKFLDEEQKRMNQEAALLLEFQANVRPSLSQVYSSIPGPELEFACVTNAPREIVISDNQIHAEVTSQGSDHSDTTEARSDTISDILTAAQQVENIEVSLDKKDKSVQNAETIDTVVAECEVEEGNENSQTANVQIENIIESNIIDPCDMEVDMINKKRTKIDKNLCNNDVVETVEANIENVENQSNGPKGTDEILKVLAHLNSEETEDDGIEKRLQSLMEDGDNGHSEYFQVTIITEELSESEEVETKPESSTVKEDICPDETPLEYFAEHEKYSAELERDTFSKFLKSFTEKVRTNKMYIVNCDTYEENILKEVSENFGQFEIVNYYKNGHLKLNSTAKNVVRNINVDSEISLPANINGERNKTHAPIFSPVKSECSFELSSDYDAKLEEMVSKTSRKEIMEIILGNAADESAVEISEMPTIDYCNESNIESDTENTLKRRYCEVGSSVNNNRQVLTPNKIRKLSGSDQISSTTEESEETSNNNVAIPMRSKYLGRARRVGLPRPKRSNLPNSPSSDKSVENYEENVQTQQPNGKLKTPRNKVQRCPWSQEADMDT